jgi:hypothetical protein
MYVKFLFFRLPLSQVRVYPPVGASVTLHALAHLLHFGQKAGLSRFMGSSRFPESYDITFTAVQDANCVT